MSHGQHGQRWKFTSFSIQKVARPSGTTLQLAVNSRKFGQFFDMNSGRVDIIRAKDNTCLNNTNLGSVNGVNGKNPRIEGLLLQLT